MSNKTNKTIYFSEDYSIFKPSPCQREYHNEKKIRESMEKFGFWYWTPIIVKSISIGKYEIVDGHHRIKIAKDLKIPFYYVVLNDDECDLILLNTLTNQFTMRDYLSANIGKGENPDYQLFKKYLDKSGIPVSSLISILSGTSYGAKHSNDFKTGKLSATRLNNAPVICDIIDVMNNYVSWASIGYVADVLDKILNIKGFDYKRLILKINKNPSLLIKQVSRANYIDMFNKLYNYNSSKNDILNLRSAIDYADKRFRD